MHPRIHASMHPSTHPSIDPPTHPSIHPSIDPSVHLPLSLSISLSLFLSLSRGSLSLSLLSLSLSCSGLINTHPPYFTHIAHIQTLHCMFSWSVCQAEINHLWILRRAFLLRRCRWDSFGLMFPGHRGHLPVFLLRRFSWRGQFFRCSLVVDKIK